MEKKGNKKNYFYFLFLLGIIALAIVFFKNFYLPGEQVLKPKTVFLLQKTEGIGHYFSNFKSWLDDFFHLNRLRREFYELAEENKNLVNEERICQELKKENELLREGLKMKEEKDWTFVSAKIIFSDPTSLSGSFWLDKGKKDGLRKGMNVVFFDKALVGRIIDCWDDYCQAESIFAPGKKISVENLRSSVPAVVEKSIKGSFLLKLIPYEADIEKGDIFVTSGENPEFIRGLLVARVKEVRSLTGKENFLKEFILEPVFNPSQISSVLIITNFNPEDFNGN